MSKINHSYEIKVGWLKLETNMIITFFSCIIILFIVGRIFILPLKKVLKIIVNSVLGGVLIYIINFCGASVGFHIGLNIGTSIFVGILGVPGAVFLIILKLMI